MNTSKRLLSVMLALAMVLTLMVPFAAQAAEETGATLSMQFQYGSETMIGVSTNLPTTTPIANFTMDQNGCNVDQTANPYQQVGWVQMVTVQGIVALAFHFNEAFEAGEYYILPAGAVFGFTDGSTYTLDKTYVFTWDGTTWTQSNPEPDPEPEEPADNTLSFQYRYGTATLIQVNTNLPATTPLANFTAGDNGCNIDQSGNPYQQVGWIQMADADGTIVLTFHFNNAFEAGQYYTLPAGAVFGFTDGSTYTLDKTYVFTWDGANWTQSTESEEPEEPADNALSFQYRYGTANLIQVNTNLPATTPLANFTAGDNGCNIDQSGNPYQQVGWIQMADAEGVIVLTFHFNNAFEAGQYYTLPAGAVFGFTDGSTYTLDKTYVFTWDGTTWTQSTESEEPEEPDDNALSFQYRYGTATLIQVNTNLPATTPLANFTAGDNGCSIDQSANPYQQVGWIQMADADGVIVLTFHFNNAFEAGQYYTLPAGAVFGFTDGSTYTLDNTYVFTWDGTNWTQSNTLPESCQHANVVIAGNATCTQGGVELEICEDCGETLSSKDIPALGHSYVDGICEVCGAADPDSIEKFNLAGMTMTLGNSLAANFVVNDSDLEGTGYYAVITKEGSTEAVTIPQSEWEVYTNNPARSYFTYEGVMAKQMTEEFTVIIYNAAGEQVNNTYVRSIAGYCRDQIEKEEGKASPDAEQLALYVDILKYGAAAQVFFKYNTEKLATEGLTEAQLAYGAQEVEMEDVRVKGTGYRGATLSLENKISMNFVFQNATIDAAAYAMVTFTDHYNKAQEKRVEAADFEVYSTSAKYVVVEGMSVADSFAPITVTLHSADGTVLSTTVDSVESYIFRMGTADAVYPAIMKLANSAYNFFH